MAIVNNREVNYAIHAMLQGVAFWMGYCRATGMELYEHDCVHQAHTILRSYLARDMYAIEYEYNYKDIDKHIKSQERADLVILRKTPKRKTPVCVMEFKMSSNTNGGVVGDIRKLRQISKDRKITKLAVVLFYEDNADLRSELTDGMMNDIKAKKGKVWLKGMDSREEPALRVARVAKAMATASKPKRSPYMAIGVVV